MVTNGPKKLAVLMGWLYIYQGRLKFHDLRVVMINTPGIHHTLIRIHCTVLFNEQLEFRYGVQ